MPLEHLEEEESEASRELTEYPVWQRHDTATHTHSELEARKGHLKMNAEEEKAALHKRDGSH